MNDSYRPKVLLFYASTHGQTARIASKLAVALGLDDIEVVTREARDNHDLTPTEFDAVVVAASVHAGHHQREVVNWVQKNLDSLARRPNAFVSVSLSAAEEDEDSREATRRCIADFCRDTNWYPNRSEPVAGAIRYREYNSFTRTLVRLMMRSGGHPTDTSRDYDYTDWDGVDQLGQELAADFKKALAVT